jgi:CheY-like chemotaxis protein
MGSYKETDSLAAGGPVRQQRGPKIVVVDDDPEVCSTVESILTLAGYETTSTSDPREAVALVRHEKPALVLTDISMPHMDGYALMEALQSDPATNNCPVVFLTGILTFSERMKAFRHGARDYVAKPFTTEKLLAKVRSVLEPPATT